MAIEGNRDFAFTPREYQVELLDKAKRHNSIILLETGSGKTFVAAMLIKEMSNEIRIPYDQDGKKSIFLVQTVALAMQQKLELEKHTDLSIGDYYGEKCDLWMNDGDGKLRWEQELREKEVLVMTAEIFKQALVVHGFIRIERINLIIFDECHRTDKGDPYVEIMERYHRSKKSESINKCLPRILGLTPCLVNNDKCLNTIGRLQEAIRTLEGQLDSRVITINDRSLVHKTRPEANAIKCHRNEKLTVELDKEFNRHLVTSSIFSSRKVDHDDCKETLKRIEESFKRTRDVFAQLGPWCCNLILDRLIADFDASLESKTDSPSDKEHGRLIRLGRDQLAQAKSTLQLAMQDTSGTFVEVMKYWLPSRISTSLIQIMKCAKEFGGVDNFSGLVFVEQRYIAFALKESIAALIDQYQYDGLKGIRVEYVVGSNARGSSDSSQNESMCARLSRVMDDFRHKAVNLLIATNVVEEGIDVPHCNCVIHFDPPKTFKSFVQAQGRARSLNSHYYVMVEESKYPEFMRKRDGYDKLAKEIYNPINYPKQQPKREPFDESLANQLRPPFFPEVTDGIGQSQISMSNAITIVNRYCSNLPSDVFTRLTTKYEVELITVDGPNGLTMEKYRGRLALPLNSPVKQIIEGPPMPTRKYAKMATAFEVAKTLYESGELDHHLLPIHAEQLTSYLLDDPELPYDPRIREEPSDAGEPEAKRGTKRRRMYYPREVAIALIETYPRPNEPVYLYLIDFRPKISEIGTPRSLGLLSAKRMPELPQFPIYDGSGKHAFDVTIRKTKIICDLGEHQLKAIEEFHHYVFWDMMKFSGRSGLAWGATKAECGLMIAPIKEGSLSEYEIDFDYMQKVFDELPKLELERTGAERLVGKFDAERFSDAVIVPWCGGNKQKTFFVRKIRNDLTPKSKMDQKGEPKTYAQHYYENYKIKIYDPEQPFLEPRRQNELTPLIPNYSTVRKRKREDSEELDEVSTKCSASSDSKREGTTFFVPELVHVHPIAASLWRRLMTIPFVLHRINTLLLELEWKHQTEKEAFHRQSIDEVGLENLKPITYDRHCNDGTKDEPLPMVQTNDPEDSDDDQSDKDELNSMQPINGQPISIADDDDGDSMDVASDDDRSPPTPPMKDVFEHLQPIISPPNVSQFDQDQFADNPHGPDLGWIAESLTLLNADDGPNLERLETVGDSFLKFAASEYLYNVFDTFHEGKLSELKSRLISNRNLFVLGMHRGVTRHMLADKFEPKVNWTPPGYRWDAGGEEKDRLLVTHRLISDKSVADCVEATIGVHVLTYGRWKTLDYLKWLGIGVKPEKVKEGEKEIDLWTKPTREPLLHYFDDPEKILKKLWLQDGLSKFEQRLGYEFKNKAYLLQAFTHPSYKENRATDCYQPLEFLGDAVLDYLITSVLFKDRRKFEPGPLTDLRSALVNNTLFAALAVKHEFHKHLLNCCPLLDKSIASFAGIQAAMRHECNFNEMLTESEEDLTEVDVPKALGDIFESVAGAIYLDSSNSFDMVWSVYYPMLKAQIEKCCNEPPMSPIRELHERKPGMVKFETIKSTGASELNRVIVRIDRVQKTFEARAQRTRAAKSTAAKKALKYLNSLKRREEATSPSSSLDNSIGL